MPSTSKLNRISRDHKEAIRTEVFGFAYRTARRAINNEAFEKSNKGVWVDFRHDPAQQVMDQVYLQAHDDIKELPGSRKGSRLAMGLSKR